MTSFVEVNTINSSLNREYDFGIHAAGCADLKRGEARNCRQYEHEADSAKVLVDELRADLAEDFGEESAEMFSFRVFPCCEGK